MRGALAFISACITVLTACAEPVADEQTIVADQDARPHWSIGQREALSIVEQFGPEDDASIRDNNDGFTGGRSISYTGRESIVSLYTLENGKIWRIRLQAGVSDRCRQFDRPLVLASQITRALSPTVTDNELIAMATDLRSGFADGGMAEATVTSVRVRAVTNCRAIMTFSAN